MISGNLRPLLDNSTMNLKMLLILCLVAVLLLPEGEGLFWRERRPRRRPIRPSPCTPVCERVCDEEICGYNSHNVLICYHKCNRVCRMVCGKREIPQDMAIDEQDAAAKSSSTETQYVPIPLPSKFSQYDARKDGKISYKEFARALPQVKDTTPIQKGFKVIDKNGDSQINCGEFLNSFLNVPLAKKC